MSVPSGSVIRTRIGLPQYTPGLSLDGLMKLLREGELAADQQVTGSPFQASPTVVRQPLSEDRLPDNDVVLFFQGPLDDPVNRASSGPRQPGRHGGRTIPAPVQFGSPALQDHHIHGAVRLAKGPGVGVDHQRIGVAVG